MWIQADKLRPSTGNLLWGTDMLSTFTAHSKQVDLHNKKILIQPEHEHAAETLVTPEKSAHRK